MIHDKTLKYYIFHVVRRFMSILISHSDKTRSILKCSIDNFTNSATLSEVASLAKGSGFESLSSGI